MLALIDTADLPFLIAGGGTWRAWRRSERRTYYVVRDTQRDGHIYLHRALLGAPDAQIDHINHDGLDDRRSNLRLADARLNQLNSRGRARSSSGRLGVTWNPEISKWRATVCIKGKQRYLGSFDDKDEAARVVAATRRQLLADAERTFAAAAAGPTANRPTRPRGKAAS